LGGRVPVVSAVFGCLEAGGGTLLSRPLSERRRRMEEIVPARSSILRRSRRLSPDGVKAFAAAQASGWEGIISKSHSSTYEPGARSRSWLKVKVRRESEFVIGGYTGP